MKDKKTLLWKNDFLLSLKSDLRQPRIPIGIEYQKITQDQSNYTLITESTKKIPGFNKINFGILYIVRS